MIQELSADELRVGRWDRLAQLVPVHPVDPEGFGTDVHADVVCHGDVPSLVPTRPALLSGSPGYVFWVVGLHDPPKLFTDVFRVHGWDGLCELRPGRPADAHCFTCDGHAGHVPRDLDELAILDGTP